MKSLYFPLAFISSIALMVGTGWVALFVSGEVWRRMIAENAANFVRSGDITGALRYVQSTSAPWWLTTIPGPEIAADQWLSSASERIEKVNSLQIASPDSTVGKQLAQIKKAREKATQTLARLNTRFQLLAAGTSELFHLELASEDPAFYGQGLLTGLPVLRELADGINTLPELSAAITKAGGVVTASEFAQDLEHLLTEGKDLAVAFKEVRGQLEALKEEETLLIRNKKAEDLRQESALSDYFEQEARAIRLPFSSSFEGFNLPSRG